MGMFTRSSLGIVFTPSWLQAVRVETARDRSVSFETYAIPLPAGCINEDSGAVESSGGLRDALHTMTHRCGSWHKRAEIFLVVPQRLCYRTAFVVPPQLRGASTKQLIDECCRDLPGDREKLVVDVYAHNDQVAEPRSVMVLAARQSSVEAFVRLFGDALWRIQGITTGEIARFNRWQLQRGDLSRRCVLVCSADSNSRELSVWDRGVLVASDIRYLRSRTSRKQTVSGGSFEETRDSPTLLVREIEALVEKHQSLGRPIEVVLFGGALSGQRDVHEQVQRSTRLECEGSVMPGGLAGTRKHEKLRQDYQHRQAEESGFFDDAIGAIASRLAS